MDTLQQGKNWLASALGVPAPFPWQATLLEKLLAGDCPSSLDLPTGLGKTAFIAIWLIARALGAPVPRRLVYVVDRRAVIDQATEVAVNLLPKLAAWRTERPAIDAALGLDHGAVLPISTLRGQLADNRAWLADPSTSAIVLGTVDMIGSRLLFEGYGVSRRMRPYHAGLLGADTLVVLDEAHLVPAFDALIRAAERSSAHADPFALQPQGEEARKVVPGLRRVALSATGRQEAATFRLTGPDYEHPVVRRRLDARKQLVVRSPVEGVELADALAREAWALSAEGKEATRCIVFCNSRDDAQKVKTAIEKLAGKRRVPVELFVGGRRVFERTEMARWLVEHGFLAGHDARPQQSTFVVATSAGEVGVDLDADHMVSDVVAWERMVQRLGRVNRRGDGSAWVVVIATSPDKKTREALDKPKEKRDAKDLDIISRHERLESTRQLLLELPTLGDGHDASPGALVALRERGAVEPTIRERIEEASTPDPLHPALTRPLLEAWSMTSLEAHAGRPEVQPWIRGWVDDEPQTTVVWRSELPLDVKGHALPEKDLAAFFEAASPHTLESLEVETHRVTDWLEARLATLSSRPSAGGHETENVEEGSDSSDESADHDDEMPAGEPHEPSDAASVIEPSEAASAVPKRGLTSRGIVGFILPADGTPIPISGTWPDQPRKLRDLEEQIKGACIVVDARLGGLDAGLLSKAENKAASDVSDDDGSGVPFRVRVTSSAEVTREEEVRLTIQATPEGEAVRWLVVERRPGETPVTEEGRSVSRAQLLQDHEACAEKWARAIAGRLSLATPYAGVLALAARLHDEGKRAPRWQRAFHAPRDGVYGKTTSRPNQRLLDGYRHELGSVLRVERDPRVVDLPTDLRDLCLHLIAAHHGNARPILSTRSCEDAPPSALAEHARSVALRFARLEKQWGPWGLAWWESLLRAADQQASRENDAAEKEVTRG